MQSNKKKWALLNKADSGLCLHTMQVTFLTKPQGNDRGLAFWQEAKCFPTAFQVRQRKLKLSLPSFLWPSMTGKTLGITYATLSPTVN